MPDSQYVFKKYLLYKTIFFLELSFDTCELVVCLLHKVVVR